MCGCLPHSFARGLVVICRDTTHRLFSRTLVPKVTVQYMSQDWRMYVTLPGLARAVWCDSSNGVVRLLVACRIFSNFERDLFCRVARLPACCRVTFLSCSKATIGGVLKDLPLCVASRADSTSARVPLLRFIPTSSRAKRRREISAPCKVKRFLHSPRGSVEMTKTSMK